MILTDFCLTYAGTEGLVICNLHEDIYKKYSSKIEYIPKLSDCTQFEWEQAIQSIKPKVILFGTGYFTREMIEIWRRYLPTEHLHIIRKGVSLSRCDLDATEHYSINVSNTPGINSEYVATYMNEILFKENKIDDRIAIIGVGKIGSLVAIEAARKNLYINLYSKTLKNNNHLNERLNLSKLLGGNIHIATTLEQVFIHSNRIAISIPLDITTQGSIQTEHINLIPRNSILVSVSSPHIFTDDALQKLYNRKDIHVVIDHLSSELAEVYKVIGHGDSLRVNFIMDEKAAASAECQKAMSLAALAKCLDLIKL